MENETHTAGALAPPTASQLATASPETSAVAVAETARALVQARYIVAIQRPRDWDVVRSKILRACERTRFAESALYSKPVGNSRVEGLSVRFAEECVRDMGNLDVSTPVVYESDEQRLVRVSVTDLESNSIYSGDVAVPKTIERSKLRDGQTPESVRTNKSGKTVYIVRATAEEVTNTQNALVSKALRNNVLRLVPADIQEDAKERIRATLRSETERDPDAARKKILDAFASLNVPASELREVLGHEIAQSSPAELTELRAMFQAIRDGETTWSSVITSHRERSKAPADGNGSKSRVANVRDAVASVANAPAPEAAPSVAEAPAQSFVCEVCGDVPVLAAGVACEACNAKAAQEAGTRSRRGR